MAGLYAGAVKEIEPVGHAVELIVNHTLYSALNDELGALEAGGCCDIERGAY